MPTTTALDKRRRNARYSSSFTTGSLFHHESVKLAALYLDLNDWKLVRDQVIAENLLQSRTQNTLKRVCREIISRLKNMSEAELCLLVEGNPQEQGYLLWLAVCRRYGFIADFAVEVLRESFISLKPVLSHNDFDSFFNQKSEWYSELEEIKPATRNKLRQILFKMLREADLLAKDNMINPVIFSPRLKRVILDGRRKDVLYLPIFESELREVIL